MMHETGKEICRGPAHEISLDSVIEAQNTKRTLLKLRAEIDSEARRRLFLWNGLGTAWGVPSIIAR